MELTGTVAEKRHFKCFANITNSLASSIYIHAKDQGLMVQP